MQFLEDDENSRYKLAQLWHILNNRHDPSRTLSFYSNKKIVESILTEDFNVNYKIATTRDLCTALHFMVGATFDIDIFDNLLARGADFTVKNSNGQTALHLLISTYDHYGKINAPFVNSILSAHIVFKIDINPRDTHGISHFHGACIANHVEAVSWFLDSRTASLSDTVSKDAPRYAGYSPLRFAVDFNSLEVARLLVNRGASVDVEDMELLIERRLEMLADTNDLADRDDRSRETRLGKLCDGERIICRKIDRVAELSKNEEIVKLFLNNRRQSDIGLSNFHAICTLRDLSFARDPKNRPYDVNYAIPNESSFCPGYTAAHFAAINGFDAFKIALGAKLDVEDAEGTTPLDICARNYSLRDMHEVLSCSERLREMSLLDGETRLVDLVQAMANLDPFKKFLLQKNVEDLVVPQASPLWAGCGILHLAVIFSPKNERNWLDCKAKNHYEETIVRECLARGPSLVNDQNSRGQTPLHLAFKLGKPNIVKLLIQHLDRARNVVDDDRLSYLHIASATKDHLFAEKLLRNSTPNVQYRGKGIPALHLECGSTPLHVAAANKAHKVAAILLRHGANLHATDAKGLTPNHWLTVEVLTSLRGYSSGFAETSGSSVLRLAFSSPRKSFILLQTIVDNQSTFLAGLYYTYVEYMKKRLGFTPLHVACYMKNEEMVRSLLLSNDEIDVNARTPVGSEVFAGCTPMHLLTMVRTARDIRCRGSFQFDVAKMIGLMLERGADVTLANVEGDTPVHVFFRNRRYFVEANLCKSLLLNAQTNYNVNPVNDEGISHFHLACLWQQTRVVKKFLRRGSVDVNRPIDLFAEENPGCTPLHLALNNCDIEVRYSEIVYADDRPKLSTLDLKNILKLIDLLLKYGANVDARDVRGENCLHKVQHMNPAYTSIWKTLMRHGAEVEIQNIRGESAMKKWSTWWNRVTGEGYIAKRFLSRYKNIAESFDFHTWIPSLDVKPADAEDRTTIHNSVACKDNDDDRVGNYVYAIKWFVKEGVDIDHQDKSGKTALHYAARMQNGPGISALLECGADVSIVDNSGKTAYFYVMEDLKNNHEVFPSVICSLYKHLWKFQFLRIDVNELDRNLLSTHLNIERICPSAEISPAFWHEVEMTKTLDVGVRSFTLFDFLTETHAVSLYTFWSKNERGLVNDDFFKSIDYKEFKQLSGIIKLQFRKTTARLRLIDSAFSSLRILMGFSVPGLCELITMFLTYSDLKNLIASTMLDDEEEMLQEFESTNCCISEKKSFCKEVPSGMILSQNSFERNFFCCKNQILKS